MSISCTVFPLITFVNFLECRGTWTAMELYVMFADCSASWDAIDVMQRVAGGLINQLGVWTEQPLWKLNGAEEKYNLNIVKTLNDKAVAMADLHQPLSIVLCANPSNTGSDTSDGKQIDLNKIPTAICEASRTSVIFGQARCTPVSMMQKRNVNNTPVGFLGAMMGAIARANVHESEPIIFTMFRNSFRR